MPRSTSPRMESQTVALNPETDLVVPVGLYQNDIDSDPLSLMIYPVRKDTGWYFPAEYQGMWLKKVFYVFSPSTTPLPPFTKLINTTIRNYQPPSMTGVNLLEDSFDTERLRQMSHDMQHNDKLGIVFATFSESFADTFPIYFFTRITTQGPLTYASLFPNPPPGTDNDPLTDTDTLGLQWRGQKGGRSEQHPTVKSAFVMKKNPKGFEMVSGVCRPSSKTTDSIATCLNHIPGNLKDLTRRRVNMVDELIGLAPAPIYQVSPRGGEVADEILRKEEDRKKKPCPCPTDYRDELESARLNKKAFVAALTLTLLFCILIVAVVSIYFIPRG